jgi:glycosyltransferase involved in cell wall biosynthesis
MISVLILTKNEEQDLPGCLESVAWSDDIHVFDSHSSDRTIAIAQKGGARVTQRRFDGYASQRNAALNSLPFRHKWVLILDADERIPESTAGEMQIFAASDPAQAAARLRRRDMFMGTWLRHAQMSPYYVRLVQPRRVRYEREVNEVLKVDGEIADLREPFDHFPFSKGIRHWLEKHNAYSSMEAKLALASRRGQIPFSISRALFARDFNERRFHQKELFYRMPLRPLIKWCYIVLARRAFLDGRAGLTYAMLQAIYEYMIVLKTRELEKEAQT